MSGDSSSSTFHDFQEFIISNHQKIRNSEFQKLENGKLRFPKIRKFSNLKINTLESLLILLSTHSYYFRLILGLIASFLAFCSALGSWLMAGSSLVARRSAPVPFPGRGAGVGVGMPKIPTIRVPQVPSPKRLVGCRGEFPYLTITKN